MSLSTSETPAASRTDAGPRGGRLSLLAVCVGFFVIQIDATAVNVALPSIARPRRLVVAPAVGGRRLHAGPRRIHAHGGFAGRAFGVGVLGSLLVLSGQGPAHYSLAVPLAVSSLVLAAAAVSWVGTRGERSAARERPLAQRR